MPWLWIPPKGNLEKKFAFSQRCKGEATIYYDRAIGKRWFASLQAEWLERWILYLFMRSEERR
ncbi:hypothetical protein, partial [Bilophila sp.]|uniref:hypothetical protein n=1 Tax=Bilophila sp. TaxID=1929485 RepID=UPI003076B229